MTAKQYLQQAYKLDRQIKVLSRKVEQLRSVLDYRSPGGSSAGAASDSRLPDALSKIIDYESRIDSLIEKFIEKYIEISTAIAGVEDETQREILERRYLLYQPWEIKEDPVSGVIVPGIAEEMRYTPRHIRRLHGEALKKIVVPEKDVRKCP